MLRFSKFETGLMIAAAVFLLWLLASCAGTGTTDVRQQHLIACDAYTTALEDALVWHDLGKLTGDAWAQVQQLDRVVTPVCLAEPSDSGVTIARDAQRQIEGVLIEVIRANSEEG